VYIYRCYLINAMLLYIECMYYWLSFLSVQLRGTYCMAILAFAVWRYYPCIYCVSSWPAWDSFTQNEHYKSAIQSECKVSQGL